MKDSVHEACESKKNGLVRSGHKGTLPKATEATPFSRPGLGIYIFSTGNHTPDSTPT